MERAAIFYGTMDLFDLNNNEYDAKPLADKMRPNNLDEFVGQGHIVAEASWTGWAAASSGGRPAAAKRRSRTSSPPPRTAILSN